MKILMYNDQTSHLDKVQFSVNCLSFHFYAILGESLLENENVQIKTIIPEITYEQFSKFSKITDDEKAMALGVNPEDLRKLEKLNLIKLSDEELKKPFEEYVSFPEIYQKFFTNDLTIKQKEDLKILIKSKLESWEPDLIICFPTYKKFFSEIYPQALVLLEENAIFSRVPFVRTVYYDPCGAFGYNFLNKFKEEIKNYKITKEQDELVQKFKENIVKIIDDNNPVKQLLEEYKKKFKKLILVPLCNIGVIGNEMLFKNDYDLLSHIMDKVPEDIGVVVTQHGETGFLNESYLAYFRNKYKNFIFIDEVNGKKWNSASLYLFNGVDAIVNSMSATGIQGLLWDKKNISISNYFNDWFKDAQGVENIQEVLNEPNVNKNNIIYWYLTHYAVFDKRYQEKDWLYKYFEKRIKKFREEGITFKYYEQNEDIEELIEYNLNNIKKFYEITTKREVKNKILRKLFSVNVENNRLFFKALGIKFSLRIS